MTTPPPTGTVTLRVYLRQSLDTKIQTESIATQMAECERLVTALGRADLWPPEQANVYTDTDRSGDDFTREQLQRLIRETQAGDLVVAVKQDRIGRDMIDVAATIRDLVKDHGAALYTTETGTAPITMENAEQTAMVMLRGMGGQAELERIRSRVRDGLRQRADHGYASGPVPFGYTTELIDPTVAERKRSKKRIVIVPEQAALLRRIVLDLYIGQRCGVSQIVRILTAEGVRSPRGKGWSIAHIYQILRNARYAGHWAHGRTKVVKRVGGRPVRRRATEAEVTRHFNPALAIFTEDEWSLIQRTVTERATIYPQRFAVGKALLSGGRLRCYCGHRMGIKTNVKGRWKKSYYVCKIGPAGRCPNRQHLPAEDVERQVQETIGAKLLDALQAFMLGVVRQEVARAADALGERSQEAAQVEAEIASLRRERQRLIKLAAMADDVPEVADTLRANHERSKALERQLALITAPPVDPAFAAQLEAGIVAQVGQMRERMASGDGAYVLGELFPGGLHLAAPTEGPEDDPTPGAPRGAPKPQIVGEASVPAVKTSSGFFTLGTEAKIPFSLALQ